MSEVIGFISIGLLVIIQIALFAFGYGKLSSKVENHGQRIEKLEKKVDDLKERTGKFNNIKDIMRV